MILSTHDPDQAFLCAHRLGLLYEGRLAYLGAPEAVITRETLRAIYGVDVNVVQLEGGGSRPIRLCVPDLKARAPAQP